MTTDRTHPTTLSARAACAAARAPRGFTLIELMIVVAIVAVVVAVALPSYFGSVRKSRRADAITMMAQVAQAQERFRANCPCFSHSITNAPSATCPATCPGTGTAPGLGLTAVSSAYYTTTVQTVAATTHTVRAVAAGPQTSDSKCAVMEMRVDGGNISYLANTSVGTLSTASPDPNRCWNR